MNCLEILGISLSASNYSLEQSNAAVFLLPIIGAEKLALAYFDGQWYLPLNGAPSTIPVLDLQAFLNQVVFNFLIGNCDAHSKNYSILYNTNGKACLSPIYDAVSTTCYPALSKKLSMEIGRHYEIDKVNQDDFNLLADSINLNPKRLTKIVTEMKEKIHNSYCAI
ncbi:MAG: HipA domain-containing protein [Treponema sp.]|nr:HipA domain-containing protein [Candidatus Treponema caballi]